MQIFPINYTSKLSPRETQDAIRLLRSVFEQKLGKALNLERVTAPLFVAAGEGINDDLNGVERAVSFDIKHCPEVTAQIVHSLAKWKRMTLKALSYGAGEGLYTNMNAIRRDEELDNLHSIYVDQWDWERTITAADRNMDFLADIVNKIVRIIADTADTMKKTYPQLTCKIKREVTFITSQELEDLYPDLPPKLREHEFVKENKTVFISQIGDKLKSGITHDGRAPDYDDWALNGDILFWHETLGVALEISSMGIRVDEKSMLAQLKKSGCEYRKNLKFHSMLLGGQLPLSIGGGIGQSRTCMLLLEKAHIGEVHASIWPEEMRKAFAEKGVHLL